MSLGLVRWLLSLCLCLLVSCNKSAVTPTGAAAQSPTTAAVEAVAAPGSASAVAAELASYDERRKRKAAVIGGCNEACETPNKAVGLLFDALAAQDRADKLRQLFDWSILHVDGVDKGSAWAEMWGEPKQRPRRDAEIDEWVAHWSSWVERMDDPTALLQTRMSGVKVRPIKGRDEVVEVRIRHPKLREDQSEPTWRFELTRRGYEWLISRVDHRPSAAKARARPAGSPKRGRL
jgi:hypothetical protein